MRLSQSRKLKRVLVAKPLDQSVEPIENIFNSVVNDQIEKGPRYDINGELIFYSIVGKPDLLVNKNNALSDNLVEETEQTKWRMIRPTKYKIDKYDKINQTVKLEDVMTKKVSLIDTQNQQALLAMDKIFIRNVGHNEPKEEQKFQLYNKYQGYWNRQSSSTNKRRNQETLFQRQNDYPLKLELLDSLSKISEQKNYSPIRWERDLRNSNGVQKPLKIQLKSLTLDEDNIFQNKFYKGAIKQMKQDQINENLQVNGQSKFQSELRILQEANNKSMYYTKIMREEPHNDGTIAQLYYGSHSQQTTRRN